MDQLDGNTSSTSTSTTEDNDNFSTQTMAAVGFDSHNGNLLDSDVKL